MSSISRFLSTTGNLDEDLENLSSNGTQKIRVICQDLINGGGGGGIVATVNNIIPVNGNVSLTSANIPEQTNLYYTDTRTDNRIKGIITNRGDLLSMDNNNNLIRVPIGTNNFYLRSDGTDPTWGQINLQQILNMTPSERLNFTIPGNSSVNMLDWLMNNSNIFDSFITPNNLPDINPFFWGTRGDADYGQWKIQNNNANAANIDRVNIIHGANFIIWQFIRSLINNIMDDNLNDGSVRVRPLGINHDQQAGADAQIINTTVNNLGRFRTLTAGTNISITQNDSTITINSTAAGGGNLADLGDVDLTGKANENLLYYNSTSTKWEPTSYKIHITGTPADYQALRWDGGNTGYFTNYNTTLEHTISDSSFNTPPSNKMFLIYNNSNKWDVGYARLDTNIFDVDLSTAPTNNQVLTYSTVNNKWKASTPSTGSTTLAGLSDVLITNIQGGQVISWDSAQSKFINSSSGGTTMPYSEYVTPNATAWTLALDQVQTRPILKQSYSATTLIPRDTNNNDMTTDAGYLNHYFASTNGTYISRGNVPGGLTKQQLATATFKMTYNIASGATQNGWWSSSDNAGWNNAKYYRMLVNYKDHPLSPGNYSVMFSMHDTNYQGYHYISCYGFKGLDADIPGIMSSTFNFLNPPYPDTSGGLWDMFLYERPGWAFTAPPAYTTYSFTTTTTYKLIAMFIYNANGFVSMLNLSFGVATLGNSKNYTIPADVTLSNVSGALTVTKTSALDTGEQWNVNPSLICDYYTINTIAPVVRGTNSLFLGNTEFTDTLCKINNGIGVYRFTNSTNTIIYCNIGATRSSFIGDVMVGSNGTVLHQDKLLSSGTSYAIKNGPDNQTWASFSNADCNLSGNLTIGSASTLTIGATGKIVYANNKRCQLFFNDGANPAYVLTLTNINTWYPIAPAVGVSLENSNGFQLVGPASLQCTSGGLYKINITICANYTDNNEIVIRAGRDANAPPNNLYNGSYCIANCFGNYHTLSMCFIANIVTNEYVNLFARVNVGVGGNDLNIIAYTVTCENLLVS